MPPHHPANALARPVRTLLASFAAWKLFLFAVALGSILVGDAYDTSGGLVIELPDGAEALPHREWSRPRSRDGGGSRLGSGLVARLTSWDAVYFVSVARRGYRFEQEWAFGAGLPAAVRAVLRGLESFGVLSPSAAEQGLVPEALAGILIANVAHLLSVLVLYRLGLVVWRDRLVSLVGALLHIVSPAGLFLSAPYAESSFALLSFLGYLAFSLGCWADYQRQLARRDLLTVLAGVLFGLATAFRSNGILNGIPFAWEVLRILPRLPRRPSDTVRRLLALGVGGSCVAAGSVSPQVVAYLRFCSGSSGAQPRPWCDGYLPSIYAFVQHHYWQTGFLRYWTVSNIPLFLLATPMLAILAWSGWEQPTDRRRGPTTAAEKPAGSVPLLSVLQSAAAAQVVLAVLAATSYHVQIITRISSGYPLWYWWLAGCLIRGQKAGAGIVMFMVLYASVQAALFASFLPPA